MKVIILTKENADKIRGNHGRYSRIEPIPLPDGTFIIPEECLTDIDLQEVKSLIQGDIKSIDPLPDKGEVKAGTIYIYSGPNTESSFVKCVQTHTRTKVAPDQSLFLLTQKKG